MTQGSAKQKIEELVMQRGDGLILLAHRLDLASNITSYMVGALGNVNGAGIDIRISSQIPDIIDVTFGEKMEFPDGIVWEPARLKIVSHTSGYFVASYFPPYLSPTTEAVWGERLRTIHPKTFNMTDAHELLTTLVEKASADDWSNPP